MPTQIDVFEFTRTARDAEGSVPVAALDRLSSLLAANTGDMAWRLDGWAEHDAAGSRQMRLRLRASASVGMRCGRCLGVVEHALAIDRSFVLAASESEAVAIDKAENELDVLVASRHFSVDDLLEDEAILALPPASNHAECARPTDGALDDAGSMAYRSGPATVAAMTAGTASVDGHDRSDSPFAALGSLTRKPPT